LVFEDTERSSRAAIWGNEVIRWIVKNRLGTAAADDFVSDQQSVLIDVRALVDKRGNSATALLGEIDAGVRALRSGNRVVVVCDFGVSRSNTIAAGILARWHDLDLDAAVAQVIETTGEMSIKLDMIESLREAFRESLIGSEPSGILITGGSGFLGVALRDELATSHTVCAPNRDTLDLLGPVVLLDRYCRENHIGKIVHLAYPRIYTNNEAMGQSLVMLRNILDVCKSQKIQLVLPSSWVVFSGYRTHFLEADVGTAPRPRGVYGETKFLEEVLVSNAAANGEVTATIVRLSPIYGAKSLRPRLIRFAHQYLMEGRPIVTHRYRNGLPRLQLLFVADAVTGLAEIVKHGRSPRYHLGGTLAYEPRDIIARIGEMLGRQPHIQEAKIDDDTANIFLDSGATSVELGWKPVIDLSEGLRHTLENSV
jgi:nucleoside-diphosphate-sugar epimerase